MNAYFELIMEKDGTYLHLIPETEGGNALDVADLLEYLNRKKIDFEPVSLNQALKQQKDITVKLNNRQMIPEQESCLITIAKDRMSARIRFYPPARGAKLMSFEEVMNDAQRLGIKFGILEDQVRNVCRKKAYCTDYEFAKGKAPENGRDATVQYQFRLDTSAKPTLNPDGSVDFFHLNTLNHCKKGEVLAILAPEVYGRDGKNVMGEVVPAPKVKKQDIHPGKNTEYNPEKNKILASVTGHVLFDGFKIEVSDVLELENVDNATGNIDYDGSVYVKGNVCSTFELKASGNIQVGGIVEAAIVEAGGDVIIQRGMAGNEKGVLKAGGNVVCKFIENATVTAKGYVETETIIHSNVTAGTEVIVTGRRAYISGGSVSAATLISVKTLGSELGTATNIEVGVDQEIKKKKLDLTNEIGELNKEIKKVEPILQTMAENLKKGVKFPPDKVKLLQEIIQKDKQNKALVQQKYEELEAVEGAMDMEQESMVKVSEMAYPGVRIAISGASLVIKNPYKSVRFRKVRGDVKPDSYA